ncbi:MAG: acyl-CoA reductase [Oscillospiraceae bacterium]|jgi:hypothetical protein|nr:acyl-CoA reductase [Oscillospiraceae bacterium]
MNLINGKIVDDTAAWQIESDLYPRICETLSKPKLDVNTVISACDEFVSGLTFDQYAALFEQLGITREAAEAYILRGKNEFGKEALCERLSRELGENRENIHPLGVLLHIAAGNADGLPVFSVLEGLLTGNINLLKLPSAVDVVTIPLLLRLFEIAPCLAEYVYVFDFSSKEITKTESLIQYADGVIVWGGDAAVSAFRRTVPPNVKLIEWGHKVSFAYVSKAVQEEELPLLAEHIAKTDGLLCSSCQGVYVDTEDLASAADFCERFLPYLSKCAAEKSYGVGITAHRTLYLENERLEGNRIWRGENCGITLRPDTALDSGAGFCCIWVKALPKEQILPVLKPYRNRLQTVGLLCPPERREELAELLFTAGATSVTHGDMSQSTLAHDGEYSLRRYVRICTM